MDTSALSTLFATPILTTLTVFILEVLSCALMGVVLFAYRYIRRKQTDLLSNLQDASIILPSHAVLLWTYIIMTIVIGVAVLLYYFFFFLS